METRFRNTASVLTVALNDAVSISAQTGQSEQIARHNMVVLLEVLTPLSADDMFDVDREACGAEGGLQFGVDQVGDGIAERFVDG